MHNKYLLSFFISFLLLLTSCKRENQNFDIVFVSSTDIHGQIFPMNHFTNKEKDHSVAHLSLFLKELRQNKKNKVIYFDIGDYYQGDPIVDYFNKNTRNPNIASSILEYLNPACFIIGNHEFDYGSHLYKSLVKDLSCPVLSANILDQKTKKPYFKPYTIIEIEGLRIAILGLSPSMIAWMPKILRKNISLENPIASAEKWITRIKNNENPDIIIGAFHIGFGSYKSGRYHTTSSLRIAETVEGFDIIFKGHDHQEGIRYTYSPSGKKVLVLGGANTVKSIAQVTIPIKRVQKKWRLGKYQPKIIPFEKQNRPIDEDFLSFFEAEWKKGQMFLNQEIGELSHSISSKPFLFEPCDFVNLIHDIQFDIAHNEFNIEADISMTGIAKLIDIGPKVYMRDLYSMSYYENWPCIIEMRGYEIKTFIEEFLDGWFNTMTSKNSYLLDYRLDQNKQLKKDTHGGIWALQKPFIYFTHVAGIEFSIDLRNEPGSRVSISSLSKNKTPFDLSKRYTVIANIFLINSLKHKGLIQKKSCPNRMYRYSQKDIRTFIKTYIESKQITPVPHYQNWALIPKVWVESARKREYKRWFPNN